MRDSGGRITLFFRGVDDALWTTAQAPDAGDAFASPMTLGGAMAGNPAGVLDGQARLHVFARARNGSLLWSSQPSPGAMWAALESLGDITGDPAPVRDGAARLHVFAFGADNALLATRQSELGTFAWSALTSLGTATPEPLPPLPVIPVIPPAPPTPPLVIPPLKAINVKLSFSTAKTPTKTSTRLKWLRVRDVPPGATVTATCAAGCARRVTHGPARLRHGLARPDRHDARLEGRHPDSRRGQGLGDDRGRANPHGSRQEAPDGRDPVPAAGCERRIALLRRAPPPTRPACRSP